MKAAQASSTSLIDPLPVKQGLSSTVAGEVAEEAEGDAGEGAAGEAWEAAAADAGSAGTSTGFA
jgi:hypothetical protein